MKKIRNILLAVTICITNISQATVRTLNNNTPSPGQYTTWDAVQTASSAGDTVYVSGSPISYGEISVTVYNLTIIGTGYNPQKQNALVSEFENIHSIVGQIRIIGLKCKKLAANPPIGSAVVYANNCNMVQLIILGTGEATVNLRNNIITGEISGGYNFLSCNNISNITGEISNNICFGQFYLPLNQIVGLNIYNNLFIADQYGRELFIPTNRSYYYSIFKNNILVDYSSDGILFNTSPNYINSNSVFTNNIVFTGALINFSNYINSITSNPLFVNVPCINNTGVSCPFNLNYDYHLSTSSPGHNAGTDGTDIGPYGGTYGESFNIYGEPPIPQIKQLNVPTKVVSGQNFSVNIISTVK